MKIISLCFVILFICMNISYACISDVDCDYGQKCLKPKQSYSTTGRCAKEQTRYGDYGKDYGNDYGRIGPKKVKGCQFNSDCSPGYKCLIESGQLYGLCSR